MAIQVPSVTGPSVRSRALPAPQVRPEPVDNADLGIASAGLKAAQVIAQKSADDADTAAVIQAESQLSDWKLKTMFAPETGVYNRKGGNALDITNQTLPQFDQEAERISASLTNDRQRARFQQISASQRQSLNGELNRYEFGERNQYYDDVDKASLQSAQAGALAYYQDPQQVAYYQTKGARVIAAQGQRKGLPAELIGQQTSQYISGVATEVIGRMAVDDPMQAQRYYASAYHTMTPADQLKVTELLGTSVRKQWGSQMGTALWGGGTLGDNGLPTLIIQAESSGDPLAVSPKGAQGLMQLMPDTAKEMAAELNIPYDEARLTTDPNYNVTLGTAYLNKMLGRYNGNSTLAVAAYNAGPGAVDKWVKENGDPRKGEVTNAEWIERIPYGETKAYTGKIIAQLGEPTPGAVRYADAVKRAQGIEDAGLRQATLDRLDDLKKADDIEQKANYEQAADIALERGYAEIPTPLLNGLSADDKVKLQKLDEHRRKGTEPTTDEQKFRGFLTMPAAQLAALSPARDIRPYLNDSDYAKIDSAWQDAQRGGQSKQQSLAAEDSAVRTVMGLAGIQFGNSKAAQDPENLQKRQQFEANYNRLRAAFTAKNGAEPTPEEAQAIAEQLLVNVRLGGTGFFSPTQVKAYQVKAGEQPFVDEDDIDIDELTPRDRQQAVDRLRSQGINSITPETLTQSYIEILKARGLEVRK